MLVTMCPPWKKYRLQKNPWLLYSFNEAPEYNRLNPFIVRGYRGPLNMRLCLASIFWWTNQTANIWTHLLPFFFFNYLTVRDFILSDLPASASDKFNLFLIAVAVQSSLLASSVLHVFLCHSAVLFRHLYFVDQAAAAFAISTMVFTFIHYLPWQGPFWYYFHLCTCVFIFVLTTRALLPFMQYTLAKKLLFLFFCQAYIIVPVTQALSARASDAPCLDFLLGRAMLHVALTVCSVLIYIYKVPERYLQGIFDYVGSSHQLWHIGCVIMFYNWYDTGLTYIGYKAKFGERCTNFI